VFREVRINCDGVFAGFYCARMLGEKFAGGLGRQPVQGWTVGGARREFRRHRIAETIAIARRISFPSLAVPAVTNGCARPHIPEPPPRQPPIFCSKISASYSPAPTLPICSWLVPAHERKRSPVRAALGASAKRIVRQLLIESMVLGIAGGVAGVLLAYQGVAWIVAHGPASVPRLDQSSVDGFALAFACAATLISGLLFGIAPALHAASMRLSEAIKEGVGTLSVSRDRVQSVLVVGEVELALVLMTGAGLPIRSALLVLHLNPGFDAANLVVGRVGLPDAKYHDPSAARQTVERMIDAVAALPGVESSAVVSRVPLGEGWSSNGLIAEAAVVAASMLGRLAISWAC
jgi:hypothetical protein